MSNYEGSAARTVTVKVSDDRWTRLGEGPAIVGVHGSEIMFATGDVEPSGDDVGLLVRFDGSPMQELWFCPSRAAPLAQINSDERRRSQDRTSEGEAGERIYCL
jgi:hypothetical protein